MRVAIVQRVLPGYRLPFFARVEERLREAGHECVVFHGHHGSAPGPPDVGSTDACTNVLVRNRYLRLGGRHAFLQRGLSLRRYDVVVFEHASRNLSLYYKLAVRRLLGQRWVWWGHGSNYQERVPTSLVGRLAHAARRRLLRAGDHYLVYTDSGRRLLLDQGLAEDRVTVLYNTIDVRAHQRAGAAVGDETRQQLRSRLGLHGKRVLLFCGRLSANKRVDMLIDGLEAIREAAGEPVALVLLGDGEERARLERRADDPDIHFVGHQDDPVEVAAYFQCADLLTIPDMVGLVVIHGFCHGLPLATTESDRHSPEVDYLEHGVSGIVVPADDYARSVGALLADRERLGAMRVAAAACAERHDIEAMVERFVSAVLAQPGVSAPRRADARTGARRTRETRRS